MAIKHKKYLWTAVLESCISIGFFSVCLATEYWVEANTYTRSGEHHYVNYGLIKGSFYNLSLDFPASKHDIFLTCIDNKICAYSCRGTVEARINELEMVLHDERIPDFSCNNDVYPVGFMTESAKTLDMTQYDAVYILIVLGLVFAIISFIFEIYNILGTPESALLGTFGLALWNGVPIVCSAAILISWGIYYNNNISTNLSFIPVMVGINYRLVTTNLGYTYW
ncbi:uncharacterized protein LOC143912790 isoform X2 [Arctopsyche grandis]